jgi:3alpha(or 20beta)-hydroxysteroid dehydrogenase
MQRFNGKTVAVTGGAQGMGESHARGFYSEGAKVVILDIQEVKGKAVADALGRNALFVPLDVKQEDSWTAAVARIEHKFGPIAVLVNNAGAIEPQSPIKDMKLEVWRETVEVNLTGSFLGIRAVVPSMQLAGGGSIVNISSTGGFMGLPRHSAYSASKWGIRGLTKSAAIELGRFNIRVNTVHPGFTDTPMMRAGGTSAKTTANFAIPRIAHAEEVTKMVMYLASDDASFSTGSEFVVDGGYLLSVGTAHNANETYS